MTSSTYYEIPKEYFFRIHHVRPRFKSNLDSVLFYVATEISNIGECEKKEFVNNLNAALKVFPGNGSAKDKTISNWRTEISALFGFIVDTGKNYKPSKRAVELAADRDLVKFFKIFLYSFQYPGAHIKSKDALEQIEHGVHFKPAQCILTLLKYARDSKEKEVYITKEEACYCLFNDLRVTRDHEVAKTTWERIKENRCAGVRYDPKSDVIRYAGDIIDYMSQADLLRTYDGKKFYLNDLDLDSIDKFIESKEWFPGYDSMIKSKSGSIKAVNACKDGWTAYVNRDIDETDFYTDPLKFLATNEEELKQLEADIAREDNKMRKRLKLKNLTTKDIGDIGECLVQSHERMKLKNEGKEALIPQVVRYPNEKAKGYDIRSFASDDCGGEMSERQIEVKTTISPEPIVINKFNMTTNEWVKAEGYGKTYYVYRLMLYKKDPEILLLQDPVGLYKCNSIKMTPRMGASVEYDSKKVGTSEKLIRWK